MKRTTITSIIILLIIFASKGFAQHPAETDGFINLFEPVADTPEISRKIDFTNEFKMILTGGFVFYKACISSQDGIKCTFYPSCSEYALQTINVNGVLGILDAIDRLTRCNGLSPEKYSIHEKSHRLYDPVEKLFRQPDQPAGFIQQ